MKKAVTLFCLALIMFVLSENVFAQHDLLIGKSYVINSEELGEERKVNVYLPEGYNQEDNSTYPVIYLLDGSYKEDFIHIAGVVKFFEMYDLIPPTILIGIENVDRYRDFTHPTESKEDLKGMPNAGGSKAFISFLEKELKPFINANYATSDREVLIGQSLGGLLSSEVLLKHSHLFTDYLIVSPSLWWNDQELIDSAESFLQTNSYDPKNVFISLGKEHPVMHEVVDRLSLTLKNDAKKRFNVIYVPILEENHATILHKAVYNGLENIFSDHKSKYK